jgi:trimeric autotransporter adhesin
MRRLPSIVAVLPLAVIALALSAGPSFSQQILTSVVGGGPDGVPATSANLSYTTGVTIAPSGDMYVVAWLQNRVYRVDAAGRLFRVAGHGGTCGASPYGDGLPARNACLSIPSSVAVDGAGNVFIADTGHHVIRRVDPVSGAITRFAGNFADGPAGDGGLATLASLNTPTDVAMDGQGNVLIADRKNHRIRKVSAATGIITTVAGTGLATGSVDGEGTAEPRDNLGDGELATAASLKSPYGVAIDSAGNIYIGDTGNNRVRRVDAATGIITTVAGNGTLGYTGDDVPATSTGLSGPMDVTVDSAGNLFIADSNDLVHFLVEDYSQNHHVRRVDAVTHIITTVAGIGAGFSGDGGPATVSLLEMPEGVAVDAQGNVFIADRNNNRVRKVQAATGIIDTVAGTSIPLVGGPAHSISVGPAGMVMDSSGDLLFADPGIGLIRRVDHVTGEVSTVAGDPDAVAPGDGGPALNAFLECPYGLNLDTAGNIYFSDFCAHRVRKITKSTGIITTVAGNGQEGYGGDGGPAVNARLDYPEDVAISAAGDIYIAEQYGNRIRRVNGSTGIITTVAGTGFRTGSIDGPGGDPRDDLGDGGPASLASVGEPLDVLVEPSGDLLIVESANNRVRRISKSSGSISTVIGNGAGAFSGDGGPALLASLRYPNELARDAAGNLYLADEFNDRIRRVDAVTGTISTVAGNGTRDFSPDGAAALASSVYAPNHVLVGPDGTVYFSTPRYGRIRALPPAAVSAGAITGPLDVTRGPTGTLTLTWGQSCSGTDNDYEIYEGTLGDFTSHVSRFCSTSGLTSKTFTPASGSAYYLVVPRNAVREGSYGTRSDGAERPPASSACLPALVATVCQ